MAFDVSSRAKRVTVVPDTKLSGRILPQKEPVISLGKDQDVSNGKDLANEFNVDRRSDDIHKWDDYENGQVRYGTSKGFKRLTNHYNQATHGTGMMKDESLTLKEDKYELGVNFRSEESTVQRGGFGIVTKCVDLESGHEFALKKVRTKQFNISEVLIPEHRHVCRVHGIIVQKEQIWLLLDWAGEALDKFVCDRSLECSDILDLMIQGLEALTHLDRYGLRHLDIKPNNWCIKSDQSGSKHILRLIDFGTARFSQESTPRSGSTCYYYSPELCKYLTYQMSMGAVSSKNDIYQFGLVILNIMAGGRTHVMKQMALERCMEKRLTKDSIKTEYYEMICSDEHVGEKVVERWCCEEMKPLLLKLIKHSPEDRMNAPQALTQAKKLQRQLQTPVNCMADESKPPDKRAKFECDADGTCGKLPEFPSLYDKQTSSDDETYRCVGGNLPLFGELLGSEQNIGVITDP